MSSVRWEILNVNRERWGRETYPTREAAEADLRAFFKGVSGVRFNKFSIEKEKNNPEGAA